MIEPGHFPVEIHAAPFKPQDFARTTTGGERKPREGQAFEAARAGETHQVPGLGRIVATAEDVQHDWLMTGTALENQGLGALAADVERVPAIAKSPDDSAGAGGGDDQARPRGATTGAAGVREIGLNLKNDGRGQRVY